MPSDARIGIRTDTKQTEDSVKSVRGLFKSLGDDAKKSILTGVGLGVGASAFGLMERAVGGVANVLGEAVQQAIADEESVGRLTASLKANVPGWDGNTKAIEKRIEAGQRLGFSDDELRASLTVLVGATHDVSKAQELQSAAMDLARYKGIDLATASDALTKVEGGRYRILASLGIMLQKGATQTEVLAAIQKVAAGQAAAYGDSTAGAVKEASIAFDEAKEKIGYAFLPIVKELAHFVRDELAPAMETLTSAVRGAQPVWDALGFVVGRLADGIMAVGAPIIIAKGLIDGLTGAGKEAAVGLQIMPDGMRRAMEGTVSAAQGGAGTVVDIVRKMPQDMADAMLAEQQKLADPIHQLLEFIKAELSPAEVIARDKGFLMSKELARGLASNDPLIAQKAQEMKQAALVELGSTAGVWSAGKTLGSTWIAAIVAAIAAGKIDMITAVTGIRNIMGHSLPTEGPLKGDAAEQGGKSIGLSWGGHLVEAIRDSTRGLLDGVKFPSPSMGLRAGPFGAMGGGQMAPIAAAGGGAFAGVGSPGMGVREFHFHFHEAVYADGPGLDRLATKLTERLRFAPGT